MVRWGTVLIFSIILMLFFISWFIKFPDIITSEIIITTTIPPERIVAKTSGIIDVILVENKAFVKKDTYLAVIENAANYKDVLLLKNTIEKFDINNLNKDFPLSKLENLQLGEIENSFAIFKKDYISNDFNTNMQPFQLENNSQKTEKIQIKERLNLLLEQKKINEQELKLQKSEINRYTFLNSKGVISDQEFESKQLSFFQAQKNYKSLLSSISQLRSSLIDNARTIQTTEINGTKESINLDRNLVQSFYQLKKAIKDWELLYVLKSSISGHITFLQIWTKNQTIASNENVFSVIPFSNNNYIGKVKAPALNSGKIKIGQRVNIRLLNFPDREFGILEGNIKNISLIPDNEGNLRIDVSLPKDLETTYKKQILFQQEMKGTADIVTEDLRLLERILYQFKTFLN